MNKNILHALILHQTANPELTEIQAVLKTAGIDPQLTLFNTWINAGPNDDTDIVIIALDDLTTASHTIYTILDLGAPAVILSFSNLHRLPDELQNHCEVLSWPEDHKLLARRLREVILQPFPGSLCTPKIKDLEQINYLSIHGVSDAFLKVIDNVSKFSRSKAAVLIQGETGTGKELIARALHYLGPRKDEPFIPVNCSSLPDTLFENEVFGHARGAFTDAKEKFPGLVSKAASGTLFLDEIDSLQLRSQASLLRFLQDKKFRPLGGMQDIEGHCAIVGASNQNLEALAIEGRFREDLLYRLNTITINIPPLRERPEDIALLARVFLRNLCIQYDQPPKSFHPDALKWLEAQPWPGNIRQLENCVHREFLLSEHPIIHLDATKNKISPTDNPRVYIPPSTTRFQFNEMRNAVIQDFERQYLHRLMLATRGNVSQAAQLANKERSYLGKLMKKLGINREDYLFNNQKLTN